MDGCEMHLWLLSENCELSAFDWFSSNYKATEEIIWSVMKATYNMSSRIMDGLLCLCARGAVHKETGHTIARGQVTYTHHV